MYFDYSKLIMKVYSKGLSHGEVAAALGITEQDYSLKLCNREEFTQREIDVMTAEILEIAPEYIPDYFFTLLV